MAVSSEQQGGTELTKIARARLSRSRKEEGGGGGQRTAAAAPSSQRPPSAASHTHTSPSGMAASAPSHLPNNAKPASTRWVKRRNRPVVPDVAAARSHSLSPAALNAAVEVHDVERLAAHLRAEQQQTRGQAAADSFTHLLQEAAAILQAASSPPQLTLDLLAHQRLQRGRGDKIDLQYMMLRGLQEQQQRDTDDGQPAATSSSSPSASLHISPSLLARAQTLLDGLLLSPRAMDLLISTFRIPLSEAQRWQLIARLAAAASPREAAELAIRLQVLPSASDAQHEQLLRPLITHDAAQVDTLHHYIAALPEEGGLRQRWLHWLITTMAEEDGGNNVTVATRLLTHYHLRLTDFPRVEHLKRRHELWWMTRMGKSEEFAELIVGDDVRLQRRLIQHLSRDRYAGDRERMHRWIQRWQLQDDEAVQRVVAAMPPAASQPPQPQDEKAEQLPLFTMPHSDIVFVSSLAAIHAASAALLPASRHDVLGFDCEFIPEAYLQLGLAPSHCQLLQVATRSQAFLFDLLLLSPPSPPATGQALSELLVALLSCDAVKLGMGFREDVRKLRRDFPHLACFQLTIPRYADLLPLLRDKASELQPGKETPGNAKERKARSKQAQRAKVWKAKQQPEQAEQQVQQHSNGDHRQQPSHSGDSELKDAADMTQADADVDAAEEEADNVASQSAPSLTSTAGSSPSFTPYVPKDGGLAKLCRQFLGRRLDKSCQISHWARRPLTEQQTQYAACDAFVQLLIVAEAASRGITLSTTDIEG